MKPHMTDKEADLLRSFLACSRNYLEFGSGGSTLVACGLVRETVIAVDSSRAWLDRVAAACEVAAVPVTPSLHFVDIGPIGEWGRPSDESARDRWPDYHTTVWATLGEVEPDLYLIDGRFRVACFLATLLHCAPDAVLMIHDFNSRAEYHIVRQVARQIAGVDDLAIFLPDPKVENATLLSLLGRYTHNPG